MLKVFIKEKFLLSIRLIYTNLKLELIGLRFGSNATNWYKETYNCTNCVLAGLIQIGILSEANRFKFYVDVN